MPWTVDKTDHSHLGQHFIRGYKYLNDEGGCDAYILLYGKPRHFHMVYYRLNIKGRYVPRPHPLHQTTAKSLMRHAHKIDPSIDTTFDPSNGPLI